MMFAMDSNASEEPGDPEGSQKYLSIKRGSDDPCEAFHHPHPPFVCLIALVPGHSDLLADYNGYSNNELHLIVQLQIIS